MSTSVTEFHFQLDTINFSVNDTDVATICYQIMQYTSQDGMSRQIVVILNVIVAPNFRSYITGVIKPISVFRRPFGVFPKSITLRNFRLY